MKIIFARFIRVLLIGMFVLPALGYPSISTAASSLQANSYATMFAPPQVNFNIVVSKSTDCSYGSTNCASKGNYHTGVDSSSDLDILAIADGVVNLVPMLPCARGSGCPDHGMGNVVIIRHTLLSGQIVYSLYAHLDSIESTLTNGMCISQGTKIGVMGSSGQGKLNYPKYSPHLHLELKTLPVLGDPKTSRSIYESDYWGYISKKAPTNPHPDNWGYYDPTKYINREFAVNCETNQTIQVGNHPNAVAINETTNRIYVSNESDATMSVINGVDNSVITIPIAYSSESIAVNSATNRIYVAQTSVGQVLVIDGSTNIPIFNVGVGSNEFIPDLTIKPSNSSNNLIYVILGRSHTLLVENIDTDWRFVASINLPENPLRVAVNPNNNRIYVLSGTAPSQVSVIDGDLNTIIKEIPVGNNARYLAVNAVTGKIYVSNEADKSISIIDGNDDANVVVGTIPVSLAGDYFPEGIAVNSVTNRIYISLGDANAVWVIDGITNEPVALVPVGNRPLPIAVNPVTNKVYTGNYNDGTVEVFISP